MESKNTQRIFEAKTFSMYMLTVFLCFNLSAFSQITITDVFPTRITRGMKMTVLGTDFLSVNTADISIIDLGNPARNLIDPATIVVVSDSQITFRIDDKNFGNQTNRILTVAPGVTAAKLIEYVKPKNINYHGNGGLPYRASEVFTNWDNGNGFYRSSWYDPLDDTTWPNDKHDLLAFTINGTTYSTGVNNILLDSNLNGVFDIVGANGISYTSQTFQAYSTNGISGFPNVDSYLLMADEIDGFTNTSVLNDAVRATVYDVIIDGANGQGLDLGTGISNFNSQVDIEFFSGNGEFGAINDGNPDLIITQIASPGGRDIYYYTDINGDIVGKPINLLIRDDAPVLYKWKLDLFRMNTSVPYQVSLPLGPSFDAGESRDFRLAAFDLDDFNIDNAGGVNDINNISNINSLAGGSVDMAFIAYNKGAFVIKSPTIDEFPLARNICIVPSNGNSIEFNALASIDNQTSDPDEIISYQWFKDFNSVGPKSTTAFSYLLPTTINPWDLGNYKVRISNGYGAVDLPASLTEGGTPTFWDGSNWVFPDNYFVGQNPANALLFPIPDSERNLIFSEDYNEAVDLEGCDCRILRDQAVTIPASLPGPPLTQYTLKLYGEIIVEEELVIIDDVGNEQTIPAGSITFEDGASLIQTNDVTTNVNSGPIIMNRLADGLNTFDYIYWSSPVADFNIGGIPGSFTNTYQWDPQIGNGTSTGNWVAASGDIMQPGEGYIKRVSSDSDFTTPFDGKPNNGVINVDVSKSSAPLPALASDQHWNLIGNPYPSAMNAETFLLANTNLVGFVNLWTRGDGILNDGAVADPFYGDFGYNYADEYLTHNGTGPSMSGFDGKIASGQAFFVQVLDASSDTDVTFNNAMRYDGSENAYDNDQFFRSSNPGTTDADATLEKQLIWLGLVNESNSSSISLLGYVDGATDGVDRMYDAPRSGEGMSIYSVLEDTKMTIQGRSYPFDTNDIVALGVDLLEDGIYKIAIDNVEGSIFENETQGVYLEDTYLNVVHDLRATPYSFAGIAGTVKDRFVLRYSADQQLSIDEQNKLNTFIYVKEERLYVKSSKNIESIVLYDLTGKQVVTYKLNDNVSQSFNTAFQYARGAYIAVINLEDNSVVGKKLIN